MLCPVCQAEMRGGVLTFRSSLWMKLLYPIGSLLMEKTAWFRSRVAADDPERRSRRDGKFAETAVCWTGEILPADFCDCCRLTVVYPMPRRQTEVTGAAVHATGCPQSPTGSGMR